MVFNLYALAEIIEESVKEKAQEGLRSILTDIPDSAMLIKDQQLIAVDVEELKAGDHIRLQQVIPSLWTSSCFRQP